MTNPIFQSPERKARLIRDRRDFLRFLAASPCVALAGSLPALAWQMQQELADPKDALDVMDFEEAAHKKIPPAHWYYMASGVDDDLTLKANRDAFKHIYLRPRRLVDATKVNMKTELFGATYDSPIFLCPVGGQGAFYPHGELAAAAAAKKRGAMQVLSTVTSSAVEDVAKTLGRPPWFQFYAPTAWDPLEKLVKRAENAGCPVLMLTVDNTTGRNSETYLRGRRQDTRKCSNCHEGEPGSSNKERPMYDGIDMTGASRINPTMTWDFVDRLRKATTMKVFIKGIDTHEDARLCVEHGLDGILVSNHGGRSTETDRATIDALPEVVEAVGSRIPVYVDGGFRRGTDIFKALALGAKAVGIGRPYIWGMGAFGEPGVDRVLEILQAELKLAMRNCGTHTLADITRDHVGFATWPI